MQQSSFEKLIIYHLVKKIAGFLWNLKAVTLQGPTPGHCLKPDGFSSRPPVPNLISVVVQVVPRLHPSPRSFVTFRDLVFICWPPTHPSNWNAVLEYPVQHIRSYSPCLAAVFPVRSLITP